MTYGIAIRNEFNEDLVDITEGFTYYMKEGGTCIKSSQLPHVISSGGPVPMGVSETLCMRVSPCGFDGSFVEPFWI